MKRIYLIVAVGLCLLLNGCCLIAGAGRGKAKEERLTREDDFHKRVVEAMKKSNQ